MRNRGTVNGLVTVLYRSLESLRLVQGEDEMIKHSEEFKQEAVRIAHCAEQRVAALAGRVGFGDWQVDAEQMGFTLSSI